MTSLKEVFARMTADASVTSTGCYQGKDIETITLMHIDIALCGCYTFSILRSVLEIYLRAKFATFSQYYDSTTTQIFKHALFHPHTLSISLTSTHTLTHCMQLPYSMINLKAYSKIFL